VFEVYAYMVFVIILVDIFLAKKSKTRVRS
jgi:hypothetical protein